MKKFFSILSILLICTLSSCPEPEPPPDLPPTDGPHSTASPQTDLSTYNSYPVPRSSTSLQHYTATAENTFILADDTLQAAGYLRAVSLCNLQVALAACQTGTCSADLLQLGRLTSLYGFMVDESGDLLLLGHADPALPPILTEDFVVALRNAWLCYTSVENNTLYYTSPGVSIEPDPQMMAQLNEVVPRLFDPL